VNKTRRDGLSLRENAQLSVSLPKIASTSRARHWADCGSGQSVSSPATTGPFFFARWSIPEFVCSFELKQCAGN
jgi:hypothetical protein